jgi:DNA-binding NarL/FixJ family response regulator
MVKQQVNVRVSDLTRDKLDFLSEYYGTQAEVVALAVDRLYRATRYGYGEDDLPERPTDEGLASSQPGAGIRVLVVDDEPHVRENIAKMVYTLGMDLVGTAANGEQGIALAQEHQPHIVLMDRSMPGMDGLAASEAITQKVPYARIIMTAVQGAESLRRSMLAGARDCLSRPWSLHELWHSVRRVYGLAPYPESAARPGPGPQEGGVSAEERAGLREAMQALERARDLLSKHAE